MSPEIKKLKKILEEKSMSYAQLATRLGYRSPNTVYMWMRNNKVPVSAMERVQKYIRKNAA